MEFTAHAIQRCNQRGIRIRQVEWLVAFGCCIWNRGARVYFFDRARFRRLLLGLEACERQLAEKARNSYPSTNLGDQSAVFAQCLAIVGRGECFQLLRRQFCHLLPLARFGCLGILPHFCPTESLGCRRMLVDRCGR